MATALAPMTAHLQNDRSCPADRTINLLLATFAGLGLPRTLLLPVNASTSIGDVHQSILKRLPCPAESLIISTVSNKQLLPGDSRPVEHLLSSQEDNFLSLRLNRRLCGGKGGFGSQLRAAGGRMSSRKNRDRQNVNGSNRNLDGRRLRTIDEAKKLADYLAVKPDMEKKEKEERRKRWEAVVEAADRREDEIRSGRAGPNQGRLDAQYVEMKEQSEEKTREAVLKALKDGTLQLERTGSESSMDQHEQSGSDNGAESSGSSGSPEVEEASGTDGKVFFGWDDEDDDDESEDDEDPTGSVERPAEISYEGKGKARAV